MSRLIDVEYEVKVYCRVDLDTGEVVKVVEDDEDATATGTVEWAYVQEAPSTGRR